MIPLTRYGWREIAAATALWAGLSAASWLFGWSWLAIVWSALWLYVLSFFRDPPRRIPADPGVLVSPADGKVTDITDLETAEYIEGPAVRIGIFLSVFSVHLNRSPAEGVVGYLRHQPGRKVNAMRCDAGEVNESNAIGLRDTVVGRLLVRQVAGLIARRIVCDAKAGETLARGQVFGMIKFGSRTELILPRRSDLLIAVRVGQHVRAGRDVLARVATAVAGSGQEPPNPLAG